MRLVCYAELDPSECRVAERTLWGDRPVRISRVAIFDGGDAGVYVFDCDDSWRVIFDGWAESVEAALKQAEFQYPLSSKRWSKPA